MRESDVHMGPMLSLAKARGHGRERPAVESDKTAWLGAKTEGPLSGLDSSFRSLGFLPPSVGALPWLPT